MGQTRHLLFAIAVGAAAVIAPARAEVLIGVAGPMSGQYAWSGEQFRLVHRDAHGARDMIDGVGAQHETDRQLLAAPGRGLVNGLEIAWRVEIDARLTAAAQHQAPAAYVCQAGFRIDGDIQGRRLTAR